MCTPSASGEGLPARAGAMRDAAGEARDAAGEVRAAGEARAAGVCPVTRRGSGSGSSCARTRAAAPPSFSFFLAFFLAFFFPLLPFFPLPFFLPFFPPFRERSLPVEGAQQ